MKGRRIQEQDMPDRALELLSNLCHGMVEAPDMYRYRKNYYAIFHNGEVWFDETGELIKAKYYFTKLPDIIRQRIPKDILISIAGNYPATYVSGFEKTDDGYILFVFGQTDGELFFNEKGELISSVNEGNETGNCRKSHQRLPEHAIGY